LKTLPQHIVLK